ncbi:hypothetical protein PG985_013661 [Apiospora marii]|uniref:Cyanovirin-N domain-containing protein n=1 Tax=Apiospora marii TaxID=335849 RepID=A0ABR1R743_9PEZI
MKLTAAAAAILALAAKPILAQEKNETWSDKCKVLQFANAVADSALLKVHCDDGPPCVELDLNQCLGVKDNKLVGLKDGKISGAVDECIMSPRTGMLKCKQKGGDVLTLETNSLIELDNGGIKCFEHSSVPCTAEL